jgi:hypothetical protein
MKLKLTPKGLLLSARNGWKLEEIVYNGKLPTPFEVTAKETRESYKEWLKQWAQKRLGLDQDSDSRC